MRPYVICKTMFECNSIIEQEFLWYETRADDDALLDCDDAEIEPLPLGDDVYCMEFKEVQHKVPDSIFAGGPGISHYNI